MYYFLLKQLGTISIPIAKTQNNNEPSIRIMENVSLLEKFDYIASEALISDRVKLLLEQYLPEQDWQPCVFVEPPKQAQKTFWFFPVLSYIPKQIIFASNGLPCSIHVQEEDFITKSPGIFYIPNSKGTPFIIMHISIAESVLRRGFCGLELERLSIDT